MDVLFAIWVIINEVSDAELGWNPEDTEGNNAKINGAVTQDRWLPTAR